MVTVTLGGKPYPAVAYQGDHGDQMTSRDIRTVPIRYWTPMKPSDWSHRRTRTYKKYWIVVIENDDTDKWNFDKWSRVLNWLKGRGKRHDESQ